MVEGPTGERGAALLTVLLLVAVMAVIASTALERLALATRMTGNSGGIDQARAYADAGTDIIRLRIGDVVALQPGKTTLQSGWMGTPQALPVPGGLATARVTDGGNCFNLNSVVEGEDERSLMARSIGVLQFQGLMQVLGIDPRSAQQVATSVADWIDTDGVPQPGGAEDEVYAQASTPYRTANRFMVDPSELRVINDVTPAIYDRVRPWVCALPTAELSPINVNTLLPDQAPLVAMLLPGQMSVDQARQLLARRPADGYGSTVEFWKAAMQQGAQPLAEVSTQVKVATRWFDVNISVEVGGTQLVEKALIDAQQTPVVLVRRTMGDAE